MKVRELELELKLARVHAKIAEANAAAATANAAAAAANTVAPRLTPSPSMRPILIPYNTSQATSAPQQYDINLVSSSPLTSSSPVFGNDEHFDQ
ncbi:hypothetical protein C0991_003226, partial [Blastosporella zonata]